MTMYVVDPIKRTTEEKGGDKRQGQLAASTGGNDDARARRKTVKNKDQVTVDRLLRTVRLGTPIRRAAYRVSAFTYTRRRQPLTE
jgi:hypothetical protein